MSAVRDQGRDAAIPLLAKGCEPSRLALTPAEGFLLSRIDGSTTWAVLRQIGGLPPGEVDRCLERWLVEGVVSLRGSNGALAAPEGATPGAAGGAGEEDPVASGALGWDPAGPEPAEAATGCAASVPGPDERIDPLLEIPEEAQRAVLQFEARLDRPYHEILGVARDAGAPAVKRAYFALSREFHPDRYFQREIGHYRERLDRIFRKLVEACELLCDPAARAEIERSYAEAEAGAAAASRAARGPRPFSVLSRLRAQRKSKSKALFEAGMAAFAKERWLEAAGSVRLAIAYDPSNEVYRERFGEVQQRAHDTRAEQLVKEAEAALTFRDGKEALRLYEDALHYRPYDAALNHTAAQLSRVVGGDLRRAKEYAARACESDPDNPAYHRTLGQIYKAAGFAANARRELKTALRLDPEDAEAQAELKALGRR